MTRDALKFADESTMDACSKAGPNFSLCGCLVHVPTKRLERFLRYPEVDLVEWRLDSFIAMSSYEETESLLSLLSTIERHPVVVTNRPLREGGAFAGPDEQRLQILQKGVEAGAEWVDIEASAGSAALERMRSGQARIVLSHHDFSGTADRPTLKQLARGMAEQRPDVIKIICYAKTPEDNLRVLELIPFGREELGVDIIAFCMGPLGGWSRLACLSLGSPWTYVQFAGLAPSAPGQYTAEEMRHLLERGCWLRRPTAESPFSVA